MISMKALKSASSAGQYYSQADDYYAGEGSEGAGGERQGSQYFGKGAEALGLTDGVNQEQLKALLEGRLPNGEQLGRVREGGEIEHKPGWDLTFSAPKSVSVLALVGGDKSLMDAHEESVKAALAYAEANLIASREQKNGKSQQVETGSMVAALFTHTTSRALDPQLHTHSVIINATERGEGDWRSVESKPLYENSMLLGQIYRSELAMRAKELGYTIEVGKNGTFELAEVPESVREVFSKRRAQVLQAAAERGLTTAKEMSQAAIMTRSSKKHREAGALLKDWQSDVEKLGFDAVATVKDKGELTRAAESSPGDGPPHIGDGGGGLGRIEDGREDVLFAKDLLSEREAVFSVDSLQEKAMQRGLGRVGIEGITQAIGELQAEGILVGTTVQVEGEWQPAFTTPEAMRTEKAIFVGLDKGKAAREAILPEASGANPASMAALNTEQREGANKILGSTDAVMGVQGYSGTGKTYLLKAVRIEAEAAGFQVRGMAPTGAAAQELGDQTGMQASTLASFLYENQRELERRESENQPVQAKIQGKSLWVVDEASLINGRDMLALMQAAERDKAHLVLVGDKAQLGAVEWGKPFNQLQLRGMAVAELKDIQRQKSNPELLAAVKDSMDGQVSAAINKLGNAVVELPDRAERIEQIVTHYTGMTEPERQQTLLMIPDNETRLAVNTTVRERLQEQGRIGSDQWHGTVLVSEGFERVKLRDPSSYQPGHVVQFGKEYREIGVDRLEKLRVVGANTEQVLLQKSSGETLIWNPKEVAGPDEHGVNVYKEEARSLAVGDELTWRRGDPETGLKTGNRVSVKGISGNQVTLELGGGQVDTFDLEKHQHWDYGYANTLYAAQGQTYDQGIVLAESWRRNLMTQKAFYVGISRARHHTTVYTDSREALGQEVAKRAGEKTAAFDHLPEGEEPERRVAVVKQWDGKVSADAGLAHKDVIFAYRSLAQYEAVFSEEDLIQHSLKKGIGKYPLTAVVASIDQLKADGVLLDAKLTRGDKIIRGLTTPEAVRKEQYVTETLASGKGAMRRVATKATVTEYVRHFEASEEVKSTLDLTIASKDRVVALDGLNGEDKQVAMSLTAQISQRRGYQVTFMTSSTKDAKTLSQTLGKPVKTISGFMRYQNEKARPDKPIVEGKTVWIVDKANTLSMDQMADLATNSRRAGARVVLIGDKLELAARRWGGAFDIARHVVPTFAPKSSDRSIIKSQLSEGRLETLLTANNGQLVEIGDKKQRLNTVAQLYTRESTGGQQIGLVVLDQANRQKVNQLVRKALQKQGELGDNKATITTLVAAGLDEVDRADGRSYKVGMLVELTTPSSEGEGSSTALYRLTAAKNDKFTLEREGQSIQWSPQDKDRKSVGVFKEDSKAIAVNDKIRLTKFDREKGIKAGDQASITQIGTDSVKIRLGNGETIALPFKEFQHWEYAYASNLRDALGSKFEKLVVLAESWNTRELNQRSFQTLLSDRGRGAMVITDNKQQLNEVSKARSEKTSALTGRGIKVDVQAIFDKNGNLNETRGEKVVEKLAAVVDRVRSKYELSRQLER